MASNKSYEYKKVQRKKVKDSKLKDIRKLRRQKVSNQYYITLENNNG